MIAWVVACAAGVAILILGERRDDLRIAAPAKMLASASFLGLAATRAAGTMADAWMLAAFILCVIGDAFLLAPASKRAFAAGLGAFLAGHLAFAVAFIPRATSWWLGGAAFAICLGATVALDRWVGVRAGRLRLPVIAYALAISTMVAAALATAPTGWLIPLGATLFAASDLAVARQRFVEPGFINRALGLPAYYAAQILLALSVGTA